MSWMDKVAPTGQVDPQVEPVRWLDRASGRAPLPRIDKSDAYYGTVGTDRYVRSGTNNHKK